MAAREERITGEVRRCWSTGVSSARLTSVTSMAWESFHGPMDWGIPWWMTT